MKLPTPMTMASFWITVGTAIAAVVAAFGDPGLAVQVKVALAAAAPVLAGVFAWQEHTTARAKLAAVVAAGQTATAAPAPSGGVTIPPDLVHAALAAVGGSVTAPSA